jgi:hypothetical protein
MRDGGRMRRVERVVVKAAGDTCFCPNLMMSDTNAIPKKRCRV